MLTDEQRKLLSQLADVTWDYGQALDRNEPTIAEHHKSRLQAIKASLIESMGQEAFDYFMMCGKELFNDKND